MPPRGPREPVLPPSAVALGPQRRRANSQPTLRFLPSQRVPANVQAVLQVAPSQLGTSLRGMPEKLPAPCDTVPRSTRRAAAAESRVQPPSLRSRPFRVPPEIGSDDR